MPDIDAVVIAGQKRKRDTSKTERSKHKVKSRRKSPAVEDDEEAAILLLETQILESRRHYNNIATLLQKLREEINREDIAVLAAVALCRVFCRLLSAGDMVKSKGLAEAELVIVGWLKERYKEYVDILLGYIQSGQGAKQSTALTLLLRLIKEESKAQKDYNWKQGPFYRLIEVLLLLPREDTTRDEFAEKYLIPFDDIRFHTLQSIGSFFSSVHEDKTLELARSNSLSLLMSLVKIPKSKEDLETFFTERPAQSRSPLYSLLAHKREAQEAWMAVFRSGPNKEQRKMILAVFTTQIAPWFQQPELLMDFLTDSYDVGGATSLLALSGLFYLIQERNLDYPSFYQKLYSLLDEGLLHSKHRSRFFRLLDTFMSSTHLPAALVASFIKRLARLALHGPPAGIVVVIPWIYNMFKKHPACTFMIHYEVRDPQIKTQLEEEGMEDCFDMEEEDPMETDAIESSIWEIETLQSHYHPNVATLAKIISEQFTKQSYNLEDFLDHSYSALLDAELDKELKKEPVVEYEIPKRIFTAEESEVGVLGSLMSKVLEST